MVASSMDPTEVLEATELLKPSEVLAAIHVCKLCQLRFTGGNFTEYVVETKSAVKEGTHCSACLGILEDNNILQTTKNAIDILKKHGYDSSSYSLGISIPQCIILREMSVEAHLSDHGHSFPTEVPTVKNVVKFFICQLISTVVGQEIDQTSGLHIKFNFQFSGNGKELSSAVGKQHGKHKYGGSRKRDRKFVEPNYTNDLKKITSIKKHAPVPPHAIQEACGCEVSVSSASLFIGGRYNKYSRTLSQTPWFIDGVRRGDTSVSELIGEPLKKFTRGDEIKLLSSGREDIDVRMLGNGRPFVIEILNPKKTVLSEKDVESLEDEINTSTDQVAVHHLQLVPKSDLEIMKSGEEEKSKRYSAKLWCPDHISDEKIDSLNSLKDVELRQKTPIRVLHRRPLATRLRQVHEMELKRTSEERYYELEVSTQAGTYIKELVHGDIGRTEPSLRTLLGVPIDIVELDVMSINLDWPPPVVRVKDKNE